MEVPVFTMPRGILICCVSAITAFAAVEAKKLTVQRLSLSMSEDGASVPRGYTFLPGDTLFFSCHVTGFMRSGDDSPKMFLTYQIEARDDKGVLLIPVETGKVAAELAAEDKKWEPKIRHTIALPPLVDSGRYEVLVKVKDELGKSEAQASIPLVVQGRDVAPSDTLAVRNLRFYRAEEETDPLTVAAFRPGDSVWVRFDMTGYKLGPDNLRDIEYGVKVLRPGGSISFEQPHAAADKNSSFYPQRFTPGVLSLRLPPDIKKGEYTIVVTVTDHIGRQTVEERGTYSVE